MYYKQCAPPNTPEMLQIEAELKDAGMWQCHKVVMEALHLGAEHIDEIFVKNVARVKIDRAKKLLPYAEKMLDETKKILLKCSKIYSKSQEIYSESQEIFTKSIDSIPSNPRGSIKDRIDRIEEIEKKEIEEAPFEKFWQAYPKKTSKATAFGIWTRKKLDHHIDAIMSGLNAYKTSDQWRKEGGKYIPMPSTFLNQERWEDEIYSTPAVGSGGMAEWH